MFRRTKYYRTSLVAQMVKRLSTMQETRVWSLGREDPLEKEMAIHSSIIAWKIPWTEEPGRLQSMGSQRVEHDWATSHAYVHTLYVGLPLWLSWWRIHLQCGRPGFDPWVGKIPWRRERLPSPVFWPGEFHGLYSPLGCKESDPTEKLSLSLYFVHVWCLISISAENTEWVGHSQIPVFMNYNLVEKTDAT